MPASCDPATLTHDGLEAAVASADARETPVGGAPAPARSKQKTETRDLPLRARRKRWQVESFATVLRELLEARQQEASRVSEIESGVKERPLTVVDFGAGSGALALPLAARFPDVCFVAVEMKRRSADLLLQRAKSAGLANVRTSVCMIETFDEPFDVGVALHACGNATDHALLRCVEQSAAFAVSPCCVGKLKFSLAGGNSFCEKNSDWTAKGTEKSASSEETKLLCVSITHPRSRWLFDQLSRGGGAGSTEGGGTAEPFAALAAAADTGHGDGAGADRVTALGREAKKHVELDRAQAAREAGYEVVTLSLVRGDDAPPNKNHVLVGAPRGERAGWMRNLAPGKTRDTSL
jgi:predicted RNA methylase